jgi:uncharacterized protein (DUF433 family)
MTKLLAGWCKVPLPFLCLVDTRQPGAKVRGMSWQECPSVVKTPEIMSGEYVFRGTRVPVRALFQNLEDGASLEEFLQWFPGVTRNQAEEVLKFAEQSLLAA